MLLLLQLPKVERQFGVSYSVDMKCRMVSREQLGDHLGAIGAFCNKHTTVRVLLFPKSNDSLGSLTVDMQCRMVSSEQLGNRLGIIGTFCNEHTTVWVLLFQSRTTVWGILRLLHCVVLCVMPSVQSTDRDPFGEQKDGLRIDELGIELVTPRSV